jgi:NADPH:quinone reductase-like Zn-dependent oxidoreductase
LTLGSDLSGVIDSAGPGVEPLKAGDEVFGVTNERFTGAYAEYALAKASTIAPKPKSLNHTHAASVPVVAVTAWQMVFDYAQVEKGQFVLVHGGAGNVGAFAVQWAKRAGAVVIATASAEDEDYVHRLGADGVMDARGTRCWKARRTAAAKTTIGYFAVNPQLMNIHAEPSTLILIGTGLFALRRLLRRQLNKSK